MKQIKLLSVLVIFLTLTVSCNKTPHDKLIGKWDVTKIVNSTMTEQDDIDFFNEMNKDVLDKEVFTFTNDKVTKSFPEKTEGTWEIDEKGKILTIDWGENDNYSPHTFVVEKLTSDSLIIQEDFEEFLMTTYFSKIK
ncbi:MAG: hypothetical protein GXO80_06555 [Chlorobi bacterium]|nr:hypothetical protein [Chlorobiota bacterium]